jgi:hypothetical protein
LAEIKQVAACSSFNFKHKHFEEIDMNKLRLIKPWHLPTERMRLAGNERCHTSSEAVQLVPCQGPRAAEEDRGIYTRFQGRPERCCMAAERAAGRSQEPVSFMPATRMGMPR